MRGGRFCTEFCSVTLCSTFVSEPSKANMAPPNTHTHACPGCYSNFRISVIGVFACLPAKHNLCPACGTPRTTFQIQILIPSYGKGLVCQGRSAPLDSREDVIPNCRYQPLHLPRKIKTAIVKSSHGRRLGPMAPITQDAGRRMELVHVRVQWKTQTAQDPPASTSIVVVVMQKYIPSVIRIRTVSYLLKVHNASDGREFRM